MRKATSFAPGHISGFFQICDDVSEPERKGSRNCGPCINTGVLTEVSAEPSGRTNLEVFINGKKTSEAQTTVAVVRQMLHMIPGPAEVIVKHSVGVPIGAGYGVSGAWALGTALAFSKTLDLDLTRSKLIEVAHVAEVSCGTGLGDIGPQAIGGLVIGLEPGAPPYGKWRQIPVPRDMKIVCATLSPLPTKKLLKDAELRDRSMKFGGLALESLLKSPTPKDFIRVSYEFSEALGLLDDELRTLIRTAKSAGAIGASMVMLGKAVFALVKASEFERVKHALLELVGPDAILAVDFDLAGARLV